MTLDLDLRVRIVLHVSRETIESQIGSRLQSRLPRIEQHVTQRYDNTAISLLGLKIPQLLLSRRELLLSRQSLALRHLGRRLSTVQLTLTCLGDDLVALFLSLRDFLASVRLGYASLTGLGVAFRDVCQMIYNRRRLFLLQSHLGILQRLAGVLQICPGGLLCQRVLRQRLDFSAGLFDLLTTLGRSGAGSQRGRDRPNDQ